MVQISVPAHKFRSEKKESSARNLGLRHVVNLCFSSWNKTLLTLEKRTSSDLGGHGPEMPPRGAVAKYFL